MVINLGPAGKSAAKSPPVFTYTGSYEYHEDAAGDGGIVNWQIVFLSSGTLAFQRVVNAIDVFIVDAGEPGQSGHWDGTTHFAASGGKGGNGGKAYTHSGVSAATNTAYQIVIGTSSTTAANRVSSGFNKNASSGSQKTGGAGGWANGQNQGAAGGIGDNGVLSFGGAGDRSGYYPNYQYGAGGGGGGAKAADGTYFAVSPGKGGSNGSGDGGAYNAKGGNATKNSGSGGGGGGFYNNTDQPGGTGGSGIIIIRNAR